MNWSFAKIHWRLLILGIFAIAMGTLEAIVVVYIRQLYYPQGFDFPLTMLSLLSMECCREAATIIMLAAVGIIAGKDNLQRFAYFLYAFAVWDIIYYAGLKVLLNWPSSFLTWDVLFLIPVPWIGPVLAPIISSLTMILFGGIIICLQEKGYIVKIKLWEWSLTFLGAFIILCSFVWDYSRIIIREYFSAGLAAEENTGRILKLILRYKPTHYNWSLFVLGEVLILCTLVLMCRRTRAGVENDRKDIKPATSSGQH